MLQTLSLVMFCSVPIAALVCFVFGLVMFLKTPKDSPKRQPRRTFFIVSLITTIMLVVLPIAFIALISATVVFYM